MIEEFYKLLFDINIKYLKYKGLLIKINKIKRYINIYDIYVNDNVYIDIRELKKAVIENDTLIIEWGECKMLLIIVAGVFMIGTSIGVIICL